MTDCPSKSQLDRYASGELTEAEAAGIDRHAERCVVCAERLAGAEIYQDVLADVRQASQEETHIVGETEILHRGGSDQESLLGQVIGDFEVRRMMGSGGMGAVYEAEQISLKRSVALKILHSPIGARTAGVLRFAREAQAAARLHHTNIVSVYGQGQTDGFRYYAMEMIDGAGLDQMIREMRRARTKAEARSGAKPTHTAMSGRPSGLPAEFGTPGFNVQRYLVELDQTDRGRRFDLVARLLADVADALDYAHRQGVIHRDVKPSNLILSINGRLSLTDFGLARMMEHPGMTIAGEFLGSPLYMSPEQVAAGHVPIDKRTDIYSLGATLYELLSLQPPFPGETREQIISQIRENRPVRLRKIDPRIPRDLETVCLKAMHPDPAHRYNSAGEMADDLRRFVKRYAIRARRASLLHRTVKFVGRHSFETALVVSVLAVVLSVSAVAWHYRSQNDLAELEMVSIMEENRRTLQQWDLLRLREVLADGHHALANCRFDLARKHFGEAVRLVERAPDGMLANDPSAYLARGMAGYITELLGISPGRSGFAEDLRKAHEIAPKYALLGTLRRLPKPVEVSRASKEELADLIDEMAKAGDDTLGKLTHRNPALVYTVMAWVALAGRDLDRALEFSDKALAAQPNLAVGYLISSMVLVARGDINEARGDAQLAMRLASRRRRAIPDSTAIGTILRSVVLLVLGQHVEAYQHGQEVIRILSAGQFDPTTRPGDDFGKPSSPHRPRGKHHEPAPSPVGTRP